MASQTLEEDFRREFTLSKDSKKVDFHSKIDNKLFSKLTTHSSDKCSPLPFCESTRQNPLAPTPTSVYPKLVAAQCLVCGLNARIIWQPSRCVRWRLKGTLTVIENITEIFTLRVFFICHGGLEHTTWKFRGGRPAVACIVV